MLSTLIVERRQLDDILIRIRYLLEVNYEEGTVTEVQKENLNVLVYEAFSYYLELLCSRTLGQPNMEYILDEYLMGQRIRPHNKGIVAFEVQHAFDFATNLVKGDMACLTRQIEARMEDVHHVQYHAAPLSKLGVFLVESESAIEDTVEDHVGRGFTNPVNYTLL